MKDYVTLASAPIDEPCVQVSSKNDYIFEMKEECKKFKAMLEQKFPNIPEKAYFGIKSFSHDFGAYYNVVIYYDDNDEESSNFAFNVEENMPMKWDDKEVITDF